MHSERILTFTLSALLVTSFAISFAHAAPNTPSSGKRYICRPCPVDCHDEVFDKPGVCPKCGMNLVEQAIPNVAILIWDGVELLDFAGPGEVFAAASVAGEPAYNVYTVAISDKPITCQGFVKITPNYTIENCPPPALLIIPGGGTRPLIQNKKLMDWVRDTSNDTQMILSVCTGAFVLAHAGLLDDIEATTWHGAIENLRKDAPKTKVHADRRFVDNGDIITCAGVSAGIDGALYTLSRLSGPDIARKTARYMEYDWRPELLPADRTKMLENRIKNDPDGLIAELSAALRKGTREADEIVSDPTLMSLHENPHFREMIKQSANNATATLTPPGEPGEPMIVSGTIRNADGNPVGDAEIYVFHTNNAGVYSSQVGGNFGNMGDSLNPRLFAYLQTGPDGRYEYRTIKPGQYPSNGPPAHVHYQVNVRGYKEKITELMWEGDSRMTDKSRKAFEHEGFVISKLTKDENGVLRTTCDIVLQKE